MILLIIGSFVFGIAWACVNSYIKEVNANTERMKAEAIRILAETESA